MINQKVVTESGLEENLSEIEKRISLSFQLVKKDIEDLDNRISKINLSSPSSEIELLKDRLTKKFGEIRNEIKKVRTEVVTNEKMSEEKEFFQKEIDTIKKQISKPDLKEEVYELVSPSLEEKFSKLKKEIITNQEEFEKRQTDYIRRLEKEREDAINEREKQISKIKKIFDEEKDEIMNELKKRISERDKEIASYKGQMAFLKGRINIIQESLKDNQIKESEPIKESKRKKEIFYEEKRIKKLPIEEEIKYTKEGVNPGFISKIIDSLSEK